MQRWLRHTWWNTHRARRLLGSAGLARLKTLVAQSEGHHSGEIRVCVEASLSWRQLWRGTSSRERATALFHQLGVHATSQRNGVLIYLLLADRRIEILADQGLNTFISTEEWQSLAQTLSQAMASGQAVAGLEHAIQKVDELLTKHFARTLDQPKKPNALDDDVFLA